MKIMSPYRTHRLNGPDVSGTPALITCFFMVAPIARELNRRGGIPPQHRATVDARRMADGCDHAGIAGSRQMIDTIGCWHGRQGGDPRGEYRKRSNVDVRL